MGPDDGFDRLLRGETPQTPEEDALGLFILDVRGGFPAEPARAQDAHLDGIVKAAQLLADDGEPVVRPASEADGRARHGSGLPKRRRVMVKVRVLRSLTAKVVAGLVVLMSMFGGLAFAGALPGTGDSGDDEVVVTHDVVNDDQGEDVAEAPEAEDVEDEAVEPAEAEEPEDAESDDQGEDADEQGEDGDHQGEDGDDQGEDADEQGEDGDHQGEDESEDESEDDSQDESEDVEDEAQSGDEGEED